jgi:LPS sulfotransferase NodH
MRIRRRPGPFVVFGNQRTGSTLVTTRLNSHPQVICYEEVFLPWLDSEPSLRDWLDASGRPQWLRAVPGIRASFLEELFNRNRLPDRDVAAIGFKIMYNQMALWPRFSYLAPRAGRLFQDRALLSWLHRNQAIIVHTLRRNHLKILVSHQLAAQSGRYHSRDSATGSHRVVVPLRGLKARLRRIEVAEKVARRTILGLPTIEIRYEEYTGERGPELDARLCEALGLAVPASGLSTELTKVSSDDLRDTVVNYDQVAACLSGTHFGRFLR